MPALPEDFRTNQIEFEKILLTNGRKHLFVRHEKKIRSIPQKPGAGELQKFGGCEKKGPKQFSENGLEIDLLGFWKSAANGPPPWNVGERTFDYWILTSTVNSTSASSSALISGLYWFSSNSLIASTSGISKKKIELGFRPFLHFANKRGANTIVLYTNRLYYNLPIKNGIK